ncbi:hypothetical protein [Streptantibioticus ferralitis]|uniref:Enoyl reductase n=1 Tax=Streptantibioticus ferralitis TaxID=236510 RepID=A0ABT5Z3K5_9ACTN|nr:hypothetical protein [Streptantibioticus ferralitis]MDF2258412.1 hypothetical protein [Streptantibioticus ferralitis]
MKVSSNYKGPGSPVAPSDTSWSPPPCWYEPRYTPTQYQDYYRNSLKGWDTGKQFIWPEYQKLEQEKYNQGKDGLWWELVYNENIPPEKALGNCSVSDPFAWVPKGDPSPPAGVLTPEELSKIAYSATKLPSPPVQLSPTADKQVVNLPTYVKFTAPLDRVWVTASLDAQGVSIAATTVATPVALKIDAGTTDADPQTCAYDLEKSSGGYQVDSSQAPCNITYRKSSGSSTYPLKAQITWKVTWTASANPDGPAQQPPLPDGLSTYQQDVTVKEIQTVVR